MSTGHSKPLVLATVSIVIKDNLFNPEENSLSVDTDDARHEDSFLKIVFDLQIDFHGTFSNIVQMKVRNLVKNYWKDMYTGFVFKP